MHPPLIVVHAVVPLVAVPGEMRGVSCSMFADAGEAKHGGRLQHAGLDQAHQGEAHEAEDGEFLGGGSDGRFVRPD